MHTQWIWWKQSAVYFDGKNVDFAGLEQRVGYQVWSSASGYRDKSRDCHLTTPMVMFDELFLRLSVGGSKIVVKR